MDWKARVTTYIENFIFYGLPSVLVAIFFYCVEFPYFLNFDNREIEASLSTAWIGYSFGAAFFLITLPRNEYTKILQEKKILGKFALAIMSPSLFGTLHMLTIIINPGKDIYLKASALFFYLTVAYTIYSLFILIRIVQLHASK